jgi:glycosyltransferase involved in cell wall biosynthesis
MRIGQNPAKYINQVNLPAPITVAVLTYIPFLSGFYEETLAVLKVCLDSIRLEKNIDFDLMIFDNGSCEEAQNYFLDEFRKKNIDFLFLSKNNLGKGGAWNIIFDAAPGDYIAYADSDVLFRENWLSASMDLIKTFPNVGMVTARPYFSKKETITATLKWAHDNPEAEFESGKFIAWEEFYKFNRSLGQDPEQIQKDFQDTNFERITYHHQTAIAGASHWQFLTRKEIMAQFLPFEMDRPMGQVKQLDERMNQAGYLRLMTDKPYADNLSNTLLTETLGGSSPSKHKQKKAFWEFPLVKKTLLKIYHKIFVLYFKK